MASRSERHQPGDGAAGRTGGKAGLQLSQLLAGQHFGRTPHSAMANQISALVRGGFGRDFIGVHGEVGENGQGMTNTGISHIVNGLADD